MLLFLFSLCCISGLGKRGLLHNCTIPGRNQVEVTLASRGNSASKNLQQEIQGQSAVSTRHPTLQHPLVKQVTSSQELHSTCNFLQMHLQEPEIFLVHEWCVSQETHLIKALTPTSFFSTRKSYVKAVPKRTTLHAWRVLWRALQLSQPGYSALMWRHEHKPQGTLCEGFFSKEGPHYCFERSARNPLEHDQVQVMLGNRQEAVIGY